MPRHHSSKITSTLVSGLLVASATLALGWPSHVNAVGQEEQAASEQSAKAEQQAAPVNLELRNNESRIGQLSVTADLGTSEANPQRQVIRLECHNPTSEAIAGTIQLQLTRTNGNMAERVMPRPQIAWRHPENVVLEAGGTLVREIPLPKNLAAQVAWVERTRKAADEGKNVTYPNVYFGVYAEAVESAQPRAKSKRVAPAENAASSKVSRFSVVSNAIDQGY